MTSEQPHQADVGASAASHRAPAPTRMGKRPLHFDPPRKAAYSAILKASECRTWKVGEACRKEKLAACKDDAWKAEAQGHGDWAATNVKKHCG